MLSRGESAPTQLRFLFLSRPQPVGGSCSWEPVLVGLHRDDGVWGTSLKQLGWPSAVAVLGHWGSAGGGVGSFANPLGKEV